MEKKIIIYSNYFLPPHEDCVEHPTYLDEKGVLKKGFAPSIVDSSEYETIQQLFEKYTSTGKSRFVPVYEVAPGDDPDVAIENLDPTRRDGFDFSDAHGIIKNGADNLKKHLDDMKGKDLKKATPPAAPTAPAPSAGAEPPPEGAGVSLAGGK